MVYHHRGIDHGNGIGKRYRTNQSLEYQELYPFSYSSVRIKNYIWSAIVEILTL